METVEELYELHKAGRLSVRYIPEYRVWQEMKSHCRPDHREAKYYHGRGVTIYEPWKKDFWAWFRHIGRRPKEHSSLSMYYHDRIDNDKGYFPGNVRWASGHESVHNRRRELKGGEGHVAAQLTWEKVREIRALHGKLTQAAIGEMFGIWSGQVNSIIWNKAWHDPNYIPAQNVIAQANHSRAKLTNEEVSWIKLWLFWNYSIADIARKYDVGVDAVHRIKAGITWPDVPIADPEDAPPEIWPPEAKYSAFFPKREGFVRRV